MSDSIEGVQVIIYLKQFRTSSVFLFHAWHAREGARHAWVGRLGPRAIRLLLGRGAGPICIGTTLFFWLLLPAEKVVSFEGVPLPGDFERDVDQKREPQL